jgi:hypothetical protein
LPGILDTPDAGSVIVIPMPVAIERDSHTASLVERISSFGDV